MTGNDIPRDEAGRVRRPKPSKLLADVMDALGPDHLTTRTLMAALIERDAGVGVEPRAVTPVYGWHIPVLADPPNVPYDMQENSLDIEAVARSQSGYSRCMVRSPASATLPAATVNYVAFNTLDPLSSGPDLSLNNPEGINILTEGYYLAGGIAAPNSIDINAHVTLRLQLWRGGAAIATEDIGGLVTGTAGLSYSIAGWSTVLPLCLPGDKLRMYTQTTLGTYVTTFARLWASRLG